ncbi:MAG: hypothetical protein J6Y86_04950 [Pseudobutyrivibrio sp.]|nr:hypothetical protein [Pseudobutyrivibrio sp.]
MREAIKGLFDVAYDIWNAMIGLSCDMFADSYRNGQAASLYNTAHSIFTTISGCTIPLATLFFIIAIYKTVSSTPPEQQARRFLLDALKYVIILYISSQLWNILGYMLDFASGITSAINDGGAYGQISTGDDNVVFQAVDDLKLSFGSHGLNIGEYISEALDIVVTILVYFIGGLASVIILGASGLTVIGVAFERIIKPLVILPFSAIVLGIGSCSGEGERLMWHYGKSLLALALSGAFMITAIKLGNAMFTTYNIADRIVTDHSGQIIRAIITIVQVDMTAIIITGLLKSMDSLVGKVFA